MKNMYNKLRKVHLLSVLFVLLSFLGTAQTVLIDPAAEGGFESGATFAANGWTVDNGAAVNQWYLGAVPVGFTTNSAFISNNGGVSNAFSNTSPSVVHFYRDVTFPAGETTMQLSFNWMALGESGFYDALIVSVAPTTFTPVASTTSLGTGVLAAPAIEIGRFWNQGTVQTATINLSPAVVGNCSANATWRLIFTWKNDTSGGAAPAGAVDNISLTSAPSSSPITSAGGLFTINNTLPTGGSNFNSFTDAINALNDGGGCGFVAPVIFDVSAGQTFNETPPAITVGGTSAAGIVFQKAGTGNNPVITPTGTAGTNDGGIIISGGDYITFDGININTSADATVEYGYIIRNSSATNGAQFNVIKNSAITMTRAINTATGTSAAIIQSASTTAGGVTPTAATGANSDNKFYNLTISNALNGVYLNGNGTFRDLNTEVGTTGGCTVRNSITNLGPTVATFAGARGIYATGQENYKLFNNDFSAIAGNQSTTGAIYTVTTFGTANEVYNNTAIDISVVGSPTTTSVSYGIYVSMSTTGTNITNVYNNSIANIYTSFTSTATTTVRAVGLYVGSGSATGAYNIENNSVSIGSGLTPTYSNTCFQNAGSTCAYNVRNNIFANLTGAQITARHLTWLTSSGTSIGPSISDYNNLFVANDLGVSGFTAVTGTTTRTTIADFNTAITTPANNDVNSIALNPQFVNNNADLHVTNLTLNNAGTTPQAYVTADIECAPRTDNDQGAYILIACSGTPLAGTIVGPSQLCTGQDATLTLNGASAEAGISYQWASSTTPGGPYVNMGTTNSQATGALTANTYYVMTATCSVSGLSATAAELGININALPTVSVSPTSGVICLPNGSPVTLNASGTAVAYTWSPAAGLSASTGTTVTANPLSTVTYTVTGADAIGCTSSATATITVSKDPVISSVTASPSTICTGGTSQLSVELAPTVIITEVTVFRTGTGATAAYPVYATAQDMVEIANISSNSADLSGYTVSAFGDNATTASHTLTFPAGTILPGNAVAVIALGPGTDDAVNRYFNTGGSSDFYSSSSKVGVVLKDANSSVVDAVGLGGTATGTYTFNAATGVTSGDWSGAAANGSGLAGSKRVVSVDNNVGTDWAATSVTNVQTIGTFDPIFSLGTLSYAWTPSGTLDNASIANPIASLIPASSTYTVVVSNSNGCSTSGSANVQTEAVNVSLSPVNVTCNGGTDGSFTLGTVNCGTAPFEYSINGGAFGAIPTNLAAGTYSIVVKDATTATGSAITVEITEPSTVIGTPTSNGNEVICAEETSAILSASALLSSVSTSTTTVSLGTNINVAASATVNLSTTPTLPAGAVVTGAQLVFNNVSTFGGEWPSDMTVALSGGATLATVVLAPVSVSVTNAGPYTQTATAVNPAGGAVDFTLVNTYTGTATIGTIDLVVTYTTPNAADIAWFDANTGGNILGTNGTLETVGTSVLPNSNTAGVYTFYAAGREGNCYSLTRTPITVTINALPIVNAGTDQTVCLGDTVTFSASGAVSYTWDNNVSNGTPFVAYSTVTLTATGTDANGCSNTDIAVLNVNALPAVNAGTDLIVCQNGQASVNATGAQTYVWTNGVQNNIPFAVPATLTLSVTGTDGNGCVNSDDITITASALPVVDAGANIEQCGDQNVTLTASGATYYTWNNGVQNGVAFNAPFGITSYIVTGVDTLGCAGSDVVNVTINEIPTATVTAANALTLVASPSNGTFQWIDCATNTPILGATGSTFTATENGSYAVIVTTGSGCSDTSDCAIIDEVGLDNLDMTRGVTLYPNPTNGDVTVTMANLTNVTGLVYDAQGKLIQTITSVENGTIIELSSLQPGVYMIRLAGDNFSSMERIVKN